MVWADRGDVLREIRRRQAGRYAEQVGTCRPGKQVANLSTDKSGGIISGRYSNPGRRGLH
jgi:hypothetical protein